MAEDRNRNNEKESLERREYRDKQGNVHHHTKTYMEQHEGKSEERREGKSEGGEERGGKKQDR